MSWGTLASVTLAAIGVGEGGGAAAAASMKLKEMLEDIEKAMGER